MIRLACLDMAGTTVVDDGTVEAAFTAAIGALGIEPDTPAYADAIAHVRRTMGESKIVVFRALFGDEERAQEANSRFEGAYATAVTRGDVAPLAGALETIRALQAADVRVCLTTGFSAATQRAVLDALDWVDVPDLALTPGDGLRGRPFPDMILAAVLRLSIDDVRDVAVVGDTSNDLWSGHRAGAGVVAGVLTGAHDRAQLETAPHTHILDRVADLLTLL